MKELKVLGEGANFTAVSAGQFDGLNGFELPMGPGVTVTGKVFTGGALKSTGMEMSLQAMAPDWQVRSCMPTRSMRNFI